VFVTFFTSDLKPSTQSVKVANKAQSVLRMIKRNFPNIDKDDFNILSKTYVRPHLEFQNVRETALGILCSSMESSMVKDIEILEKVQPFAEGQPNGSGV